MTGQHVHGLSGVVNGVAELGKSLCIERLSVPACADKAGSRSPSGRIEESSWPGTTSHYSVSHTRCVEGRDNEPAAGRRACAIALSKAPWRPGR